MLITIGISNKVRSHVTCMNVSNIYVKTSKCTLKHVNTLVFITSEGYHKNYSEWFCSVKLVRLKCVI